jgi:peptidoglycan/LPS O-acetylase OafA/YrhL
MTPASAAKAITRIGEEPLSVNKSPNFRPDIEGLRGISVLLVVAYHAGMPMITGGFIGVDVFFVISGYVITALIVTEIRRSGTFHFISFYARRARRLIPAVSVTIVATIGAGVFLLSPLEIKELSKAALTASLFSSNIWFTIQAADYFAPDMADNPVLHTWSLGVEEQFYVFWPGLIFLVAKRWQHALNRQLVAVGAVNAVSFIGCVVLTSYAQPVAFFGMPTRAWQFGMGALTFLLPDLPRRFARWSAISGWVGLAALAAAAITITSNSLFPGVLALVPTLGAVLIILSGKTAASRGVGRPLSAVPVQIVGKLSYSWYLWHWPVLVFTTVLFPGATGILKSVAVMASLALAWITHGLIENPIRFNRVLLRHSVASLSVALLLVFSTTFLAYRTYSFAKMALNIPSQRAIASATYTDPRYRDCIVPLLDAANELRECVLGDPKASTTVVLFGDSHAGQWLPALEDVANRNYFRLVALTRSSCPVASVPIFSDALKREYSECETWRDLALNRIYELHPSLIIAANGDAYVSQGVPLDRWGEGVRRTYERLNAEGVPVAMLRDTPVPGRDVSVCLSRADWRGLPTESCVFPRDVGLNDEIFEAEIAAVSELKHVVPIDLSDQICPTERCYPEMDGAIIYRDSNHLAEAFARTLAPALGQRLLLILSMSRGEVRSDSGTQSK